MDGKRWCEEHITERNNWFVTQSGKQIEIQDDWKFCPVCGAKRPEKPRGLAEKFNDMEEWNKETLAQVALEHFREIVNGSQIHGHFTPDNFRAIIIKRMEQSL